MTGHTIRLTCEADKDTELIWYKNGGLITLLPEMFILTSRRDVVRQRYISMLSKDDSNQLDSGIYSCQNIHDSTDKDSIKVTVSEFGEFYII